MNPFVEYIHTIYKPSARAYDIKPTRKETFQVLLYPHNTQTSTSPDMNDLVHFFGLSSTYTWDNDMARR